MTDILSRDLMEGYFEKVREECHCEMGKQCVG